MSAANIDILYLAWNRREFTEFSFEMLLANTEWDLVKTLYVHDDGSVDGTSEFLAEAIKDVPQSVGVDLRDANAFRSPPTVMNMMVERCEVEYFAKIDNDIVVPPGWLSSLFSVMKRQPEVELLGMEAGRMGPPGHNGSAFDGVYEFEPGSHIGGIGLMRTEAFLKRPRLNQGGRDGFTIWQHEYEPVRGWINPDLLVSELGRVPFQPWSGLSEFYVREGWERPWPKYHHRWSYWWDWWPEDRRVNA